MNVRTHLGPKGARLRALALGLSCALAASCAVPLVAQAAQAAVADASDDTGGYVPTAAEQAAEQAAALAATAQQAFDELAATFAPSATGERFTADIGHTSPTGETDTVKCGFMVTSSTTVTVTGQGVSGGYTAVSQDTEGGISIPRTVSYNGTDYTVTAVAAYSFGGTTSVCCPKLTSVELPDTVEAINKYAFAYCTALQDFRVPAAAKSIGERAFCKCDKIAALDMSASTQLETIGTYAFYYNEALTELIFPASLTSIGSYGFCQCNGLQTVVYEGDCPTLGLYAFTGSTTISTIVFRAGSDRHSANRYNSEKVDSPTCYYTLRFYASKEAAEAASGGAADAEDAAAALLGTAAVSEKTRYLRVCDSLDASFVYDGAIPAFPDGANVWRFVGQSSLSASLGRSACAYPEASTMFDLKDGAAATLRAIDYRGEDFTGYASDEVVKDNEGNELERGVDYTRSYERKDASGAWAPTTDFVSTGDIRVVASGIGRYRNAVSAESAVSISEGVTFIAQVPTAPDAQTTTRCAFKVRYYDAASGTGVVSVSQKLANNAESVAKTPMFATSANYGGSVYLPETVTAEGCTFNVNYVESNAFGNSKYHASLSAVYVGKGIVSLGAGAFQNCSSLRSVFFYNNLQVCSYSKPFEGCSGIQTAVFYDKKPDDAKISLAKFFPAADNVDCYFTITFYASKAAAEAGAEPLGRVTLSDDLLLMYLPDKPAGSPHVYEGAVPDYPGPEWVEEQKKAWEEQHPGEEQPAWLTALAQDMEFVEKYPDFYALSWSFPEVNADSTVALNSTLPNSVSAYAQVRQDAFSIDDAYVFGVEERYGYTGADAFGKESVKVVSALGGTLRYGVDYAMDWELYDDWEETWSACADTVAAGHYRAKISGLGKYESKTRFKYVEFDVEARELAVGSVFKAGVVYTPVKGAARSVDMNFRVTAVGEGRSVELAATEGIASADFAGTFEIPASVFYLGTSYAVTAVGAAAFSGNAYVIGVHLAQGVASLGENAFRGCTALADLPLPGTVTELGDGCLCDCTALEQLELPAALASIGANAFSGAGMRELAVPEGTTAIGAYAFASMTGLETLTLPGTLTSYEHALQGASVGTLAFTEGTEYIPEKLAQGVYGVKALSLPSTLKGIGSYAFQQCGIETLTIPASCTEIGAYAFASCTKLAAVVFEGNPNGIDRDSSFNACSSVGAIVYRGESLIEPEEFFPSMRKDASFYSMVRYYASEEDRAAGVQLGALAVKQGTRVLELVSAASVAQADPGTVYDGAVPALPDGCNAWHFRDTSLSALVDGPLDAVAAADDLADLANACVVTDRGYKYTGSTVNPINDGTGSVVLSDGTVLRRGFDYEVSFDRLDAAGEWAPTRNFASVGQLRITATAVEGSGYTGAAVGYYSITKILAGDTFVAKNADGLSISYRVLRTPTYDLAGLVQVGNGSVAAIDSSYAGAVNIPETVTDSAKSSYEVSRIGAGAFYRCMGVTAVDVPATVRSIGSRAFAYESARADTSTSNLSLVRYRGAAADMDFGTDVFLNCDVVSTVVYGGKQGSYEARHPFELKKRISLTRYYTMRFYESAEAKAAGTVAATCVVKEGAYAQSPSASDYYAGSDRMPACADGWDWVYDPAALDDEGRVTDSMDVVGAELADTGLNAYVECTYAGTTTQVLCAFTALTEPADGKPGTAAVGTFTDGKPAVDGATAGVLTIPETVTSASGDRSYTVVELGSCAFGASEEDKACRALTGLSLPATLTSIGKGACANCTALCRVEGLERSAVASVGSAAFSGCSALSELALPVTVTDIQDSAFKGCAFERFTVPSSVKTLGKRAFDGNAALREVVFGGAFGLELPALDGAGDDGAGATAAAQAVEDAGTQSALAFIDDYAFANCPKLTRIAFELDAGGCKATEVAFQNSTALSTLVFAGTQADFSACEETFAAPLARYYSIQYYADETLVGTAERLGYACVPAGTVPSAFAPADVYAGAVPELESYCEWLYSRDASAGLADSCTAYKHKIQMALDASGVDGAFSVVFSLDGNKTQTAGYLDVVHVSVSNLSALRYDGLTVRDADGAVVLETAEESADFAMPGSPVTVEVACEMGLTFTATKPSGETTEPVTLSLSTVRSLPSRNAGFSGWDGGWDPDILATYEAVDLSTLVEAAGLRFDSGDSIVLSSSSTGKSATFGYDDLYDPARMFYPNIREGGTDGGVAATPVLCVSSTLYSTEGDEALREAPSMKTCYRFAYGQTAKELAKRRDTVSKWLCSVDEIEIIYGAEDVNTCTISGIERSYAYTGDAVCPVPTVTDRDGNVLEAGVDYRVSYENNIEAGTATVVVSGMRYFTGVAAVEFGIRSAARLSGDSSPATAAAIALEAYPSGSNGAIVATNKSFPDALSAAALAGALEYPILLVGDSGIPDATAQALEALSDGSTCFEVVVIGGGAAVSDEVYAALSRYAANENYCVRLFGDNRYETSAAVFDYGRNMDLWGDGFVVATGGNFPDALSIAPYAARYRAPILLAQDGALSEEFISAVSGGGFSSAVIVGGTAAVGAAADERLVQLLGRENVTRLSGENRYATCAAIANWETETLGMGFDGVALATGERFPDALSGAALLGVRGAPLLLVSETDTSTLSVLSAHAPDVVRFYVLGGPAAVSEGIYAKALDILGWNGEVR